MVAKSLRHKLNNPQADGADATVARPSDWNADHNLWLGKRTVSGSTDTLLDADHLCLVQYGSASAIAVAVPQAGSSGGTAFVSGWVTFVRNLGAGAVTFTPTTSTINEQATMVLQKDEYAIIFSDGVNYAAIRSFAPTSPAALWLRFDTASQGLTNTQQDNAFANLGAALQRSAIFTALRYDVGQSLTESQRDTASANAANLGSPAAAFLSGQTTGNTTVNFVCSGRLTLVNATGRLISVPNTVTLACDVATPGPVAGGRDQAAAFSNQVVHFYFIYNPSVGVALIASANPAQPTLPSGYIFWKYICPIYFTTALSALYLRGNTVYFTTDGLAVLTGFTFTAWASFGLPVQVPACQAVLFQSTIYTNAAAAGLMYGQFGFSSGFRAILHAHEVLASENYSSQHWESPYLSAYWAALSQNTNGSPSWSITCLGYRIANGAT